MSNKVKKKSNDLKEVPIDPLKPILEQGWEVCRAETSEEKLGDLTLSQRDESMAILASGTMNSSDYGWYESGNVEGPLLGGMNIPRSAEDHENHTRDDDWYAFILHPNEDDMILVDGPHCEDELRRCERSHHTEEISEADEKDFVDIKLEMD